MRVIESDWNPVEAGLAEEYVEKSLAAIAAAHALRETLAQDGDGQALAGVEVRPYADVFGITRWSVVHTAQEGGETTDHSTEAEAVAYYEETVRDLADVGEGMPPFWDRSDVAGIALAPFVYRITHRAGAYERSRRCEARLGQALKELDGREATSLEEALHLLLQATLEDQARENAEAALWRAAGAEHMAAGHDEADTVQVSVTGPTADGEVTLTQERALSPGAAPDPERVAAARAALTDPC